MLYLITGANGAGKTLNTLKWVRERSVKEGRPVCHNGRFEPVEGGELSSWKKIDMKDWQAEPDGTIFLVDECHNDFPLRAPSSAPPDYVKMLAEHRRRGFDFYMVTQHPQNIDSFVRRLIGSPGWHRHLKRSFGADLVSCLEWNAVNPNCEKDGSGKTGTVTMMAFPKEVYGWYRSASLHTGKRKIPRAVWVLLACAIAIPSLGYFAVSRVVGNATKNAKPAATDKPAGSPAEGSVVAAAGTGKALTVEGYLDQRKARIPDFPHTAPAYDEVTRPTVAPYPAACVHMGKVCSCYTQQGTLLQTSGEVCLQIVKQGFFMDWEQDRRGRRELLARADDDRRNYRVRDSYSHQAEPPRSVPMPGQYQSAEREQKPQPQPGQEWAQALAKRNAEVRSSLGR